MKGRLVALATLAVVVVGVLVAGAFSATATGGPPAAAMDQIYAALRFENLRTTTGSTTFTAGSQISFDADLVSHSHKPLVVPFQTAYNWNLLGREQTWVLRLGSDPTLPFPPIIARQGYAYATGGEIIAATQLDKHQRITYGLATPRQFVLPTTGFPAG